MNHSYLALAWLSVSAASTAGMLPAQCTNQWLSGFGNPGANGSVRSMTPWDPDGPGPARQVLVVAGLFSQIGSVQAAGLATYEPNSGTWSALPAPSPTSGSTCSLTATAARDLVMCSATTALRWNGTTWSQLGSVNSGGNLSRIVALPNGDIVAAGSFTAIGGVAAANIARWDGATWHPLGAGLTGSYFRLDTLLALPTGDVIAGGTFTNAGGIPCNNVARWDGSSWSAMGGGVNDHVSCLTEVSGDVFVAGSFTTAGTVPANGLARWNGTTWATVGSWPQFDAVYAMHALPNGDLVLGGSYDPGGGASAPFLPWFGRLSATQWTPETVLAWQGGSVFCFAHLPDGDLVVGGNFTQAGGSAALNLARWTTTCPATTTSLGTGCTGSGGANVLTATSLPWLGASFSFTATGMPVTGLAVGVRSLTTTSTPLAAILPQGAPGCSLLVRDDLLDLYFPTGGAVTASFAIPNTQALATQTLHQQIVALDLTATGAITALTSTNALTLTIGAY